MSNPPHPGIRPCPVLRIDREGAQAAPDYLAVEEPLEIQLIHGPKERRERLSLAVTMRTPGADFELALGFLFTEGIIGRRADVLALEHAGDRLHDSARENVVTLTLAPGLRIDSQQFNRHFYTTSSCGVCGKASLEMVKTVGVYLMPPGRPLVSRRDLFRFPQGLNEGQTLFAQTGGIHAAALLRANGEQVLLYEDVGRHNALDKLIGAALERNMLPLSDYLILVSGRAGFELAQKTAVAGAPFLAAVGAASSLAVELAEEYGMTLVGFLRDGRANVYCGGERVGD
jgi:FdhD protein